MGSSGFSSDFTEVLRVLAVDGTDKKALKNLETMLTECNYQVTTCNSAKEAIGMLGTNYEKFKFHIVMSDVSVGSMKDFEFLKYVSLNLQIPVIMMTGDGETSKVMKGIQCGACIHLLKPIEKKELQFIWQHVVRKRMQQRQYQIDEICEHSLIAEKKRKGFVIEGSGSFKKPRLFWTDELDNKFKKVVEHIGIEKARPNEVLKLMRDSSLTRANISSRLQKYKQKMSKRAAATATQVSQQPVVLLPKINSYDGHSLYQPLDFQNSELQSSESKIGHSFNQSFNYHNSQLQSEHMIGHSFDQFIVFQDHAERAPVPRTMRSIEKEQNLEQNTYQNQNFGCNDPNISTLVPPHDAYDSEVFNCQDPDDLPISLEELGLDSWFYQYYHEQ